MIEIKVTLGRSALARAISGLNKIERGELLQASDAEESASRAVSFLKRIYPRSKTPKGPSHLGDGWKADVQIKDKTISFIIKHRLENNKKSRFILNQLENGTPAYSYVMKNQARFKQMVQRRNLLGQFTKGKKGQWTRLVVGREIHQPAREGGHYLDKTREYVDNVLLFNLKARVLARAKEAM